MSFGHKLRDLRKQSNLSQIELAKALNITNQTLSHYELNKRIPDLNMISKMADYFDISVDYLLGRVDQNEIYVSENLTQYNHEDFTNIKNLSDENQKKILDYIRMIKLLEDKGKIRLKKIASINAILSILYLFRLIAKLAISLFFIILVVRYIFYEIFYISFKIFWYIRFIYYPFIFNNQYICLYCRIIVYIYIITDR